MIRTELDQQLKQCTLMLPVEVERSLKVSECYSGDALQRAAS